MIAGVHVSSSEMIVNRDHGKKKTIPKFIKGQVIPAKILRILPQGKAEILVNNQKLAVKTALSLTPGEEIQLKVMSKKDDIILKLIDPVQKMTSQQVSSLVRLFSTKEALPDIFDTKTAGVKTLLYEMALKSDKPDREFLPRLIEKMGMVWEKKLARVFSGNTPQADMKALLENLLQQDLKANILKHSFLAGSGSSETGKTALAFLETLENFQLLNSGSSDSGRFLLPFPIFNDSGFRFGQMFIDTGGKSKEEDREGDKVVNISFLLDMTRLGPLRADFSILKQEISGRFLLENEKICGLFKAGIPELKKKLGAIHYHVRNIDCSVAQQEEIRPTGFIETLVKARDDRVLNIVI